MAAGEARPGAGGGAGGEAAHSLELQLADKAAQIRELEGRLAAGQAASAVPFAQQQDNSAGQQQQGQQGQASSQGRQGGAVQHTPAPGAEAAKLQALQSEVGPAYLRSQHGRPLHCSLGRLHACQQCPDVQARAAQLDRNTVLQGIVRNSCCVRQVAELRAEAAQIRELRARLAEKDAALDVARRDLEAALREEIADSDPARLRHCSPAACNSNCSLHSNTAMSALHSIASVLQLQASSVHRNRGPTAAVAPSGYLGDLPCRRRRSTPRHKLCRGRGVVR